MLFFIAQTPLRFEQHDAPAARESHLLFLGLMPCRSGTLCSLRGKEQVRHELGVLALIPLHRVPTRHRSGRVTHPDLYAGLRRSRINKPLCVAVSQIVEPQFKRSPCDLQGTLEVLAEPLIREWRWHTGFDPRPEPF